MNEKDSWGLLWKSWFVSFKEKSAATAENGEMGLTAWKIFLYSKYRERYKVAVPLDLLAFFCLTDSTYRPHINRQKGFRELFHFCEDIRSQNSEIRFQRSQRLFGHPNFSSDTAVFKFSNYCYWMCKHIKYLFCLIVPLKSVRSLQSFEKVSA